MNSKADADWFVQQPDIAPKGGRFTVTLEPGCLYTVSTIPTAHKGTTAPPASAAMPLPYREDFQSYEIGRTPKYLSDQGGAFEIAQAGGGRDGMCLRQVVTAKPIIWNRDGDPGTITGHPSWKNYTVSVDVLLEQTGYAEVIGRVPVSKTQNSIPGYFLRLDERGHWSLGVGYDPAVRKDLKEKELASGDLPDAAGINKWNKLSLGFCGSTITASVNGHVVATVEDKTYDHGLIALMTNRWNTSEFLTWRSFPTTFRPINKDHFRGCPGPHAALPYNQKRFSLNPYQP